MKEFPLKKTISQVAYEWNSFFKDGKNPLGYGINYGWLEDIKKYYYNKFNGKYVKTKLPIPNLLDTNIEKISLLVNSKSALR